MRGLSSGCRRPFGPIIVSLPGARGKTARRRTARTAAPAVTRQARGCVTRSAASRAEPRGGRGKRLCEREHLGDTVGTVSGLADPERQIVGRYRPRVTVVGVAVLVTAVRWL